MVEDKKKIITGYPDLTQFVRSIQRIEGNPDCFARTTIDCDSLDCQWYSYCFKELKKIKGSVSNIPESKEKWYQKKSI